MYTVPHTHNLFAQDSALLMVSGISEEAQGHTNKHGRMSKQVAQDLVETNYKYRNGVDDSDDEDGMDSDTSCMRESDLLSVCLSPSLSVSLSLSLCLCLHDFLSYACLMVIGMATHHGRFCIRNHWGERTRGRVLVAFVRIALCCFTFANVALMCMHMMCVFSCAAIPLLCSDGPSCL